MVYIEGYCSVVPSEIIIYSRDIIQSGPKQFTFIKSLLVKSNKQYILSETSNKKPDSWGYCKRSN